MFQRKVLICAEAAAQDNEIKIRINADVLAKYMTFIIVLDAGNAWLLLKTKTGKKSRDCRSAVLA
ncbi:MAG TPA: hypothetical protein DEA22_02710 [Blastocatellia bacterium]|nr:hypothetical protein [Blastocatellia bacterium]